MIPRKIPKQSKIVCSAFLNTYWVFNRFLAESTMALVRNVYREVDLLRVEGEQGRSVYSLNNFNIGQIRNTMIKCDQYWYLGQTLKPYLTFFFQSFKVKLNDIISVNSVHFILFKNLNSEWDENNQVHIKYTPPCSGCSKCYSRFVFDDNQDSPAAPQVQPRWWQMFASRAKQQVVVDDKAVQLERIKSTTNDLCDQKTELQVCSKNIFAQNLHEDGSSFELTIHPPQMTTSNFISEGYALLIVFLFVIVLHSHFRVRVLKNQQFSGDVEKKPFTTIQAKDVQFKFAEPEKKSLLKFDEQGDLMNTLKGINTTTDNKTLDILDTIAYRSTAIKELDDDRVHVESSPVASDAPTPSADDEVIKWLSIDNENYEYQSSIKLTLLPKRVKIYCAGQV